MIRLIDVTLAYEDKKILSHTSYDFPAGENVALMGASGSGKTTLLKAIAGLLAPNEGRVEGAGARIAFLFQEDRLLPWRTAKKNVSLVSGDEALAERTLRALQITDMDKYPDELSGGMRRRVALARALCFSGDLLILDEPFQGLDEKTREHAAHVILSFHVPLLLATHEKEDAALLNAKIVKMDELQGKKPA